MRDLFISSAPTMTKPLTMSWLPSPFAPVANCARPTLPPAPGTLVTCTLLTSLAAISACCMARAVWSQPPPGAAGAMIFNSIWARTGVVSAASASAAMTNVRMRPPQFANYLKLFEDVSAGRKGPPSGFDAMPVLWARACRVASCPHDGDGALAKPTRKRRARELQSAATRGSEQAVACPRIEPVVDFTLDRVSHFPAGALEVARNFAFDLTMRRLDDGIAQTM